MVLDRAVEEVHVRGSVPLVGAVPVERWGLLVREEIAGLVPEEIVLLQLHEMRLVNHQVLLLGLEGAGARRGDRGVAGAAAGCVFLVKNCAGVAVRGEVGLLGV